MPYIAAAILTKLKNRIKACGTSYPQFQYFFPEGFLHKLAPNTQTTSFSNHYEKGKKHVY